MDKDQSILLSAEEINYVFHEVPVDVLLSPIKHNNNKYRMYIPRLGRMTSTSPAVKSQIYDIAVRQFNRNDLDYTRLFEDGMRKLYNVFIDTVNDYIEGEVILEKYPIY